jgi:hypothetical protein
MAKAVPERDRAGHATGSLWCPWVFKLLTYLLELFLTYRQKGKRAIISILWNAPWDSPVKKG